MPRKDYTRRNYQPFPRFLANLSLHLNGMKKIPSQPAKLQIILDYVVEAFTPGVVYTEKEVNMLMRRFHIDTAALRRYLVDRGMLERKSDGSQ